MSLKMCSSKQRVRYPPCWDDELWPCVVPAGIRDVPSCMALGKALSYPCLEQQKLFFCSSLQPTNLCVHCSAPTAALWSILRRFFTMPKIRWDLPESPKFSWRSISTRRIEQSLGQTLSALFLVARCACGTTRQCHYRRLHSRHAKEFL